MKKKLMVLSLGGSIIIPDKVNVSFLKDFRRVIKKNTKKYKFIVVCGGGGIARTYISALQKVNMSTKLQNFAGISTTRMNARFMSYFFGINPERGIPHKLREIKKYLNRQDVVFCGALEYHPHETSDSTAANIAKYFKTEFINLTNVQGLFDKDPSKYKNPRFIPKISWSEFNKVANKMDFKPGMHFVLDPTASKIIMENKIVTYILGKRIQDLDDLLKEKKFKGTIIIG